MKPGSLEWHEWLIGFWTDEANKRTERLHEAQRELEAAWRAINEHVEAAKRLKAKAA